MATATELLARLRDEPNHASELADVLLEVVLATPAREFIAPERIVPAFVAGLRASIAGLRPERLEALLTARRWEALSRPGAVAERFPPELLRVLQTALRRPMTPGRELVRAVLDQAGMRSVVRSVLQTTLVEFVVRLRAAVPDTSWIPGAGIRSKLMGVARGVASAVGAEASRQLEDRVRSFVDGALDHTLEQIVEHISNPRHAAEMAGWRGDAVASLLALPEAHFIAETRQLDPKTVTADVIAGLTAVAQWDRLAGEVEAVLHDLVTVLKDATVGELLAEDGLDQAWRKPVHGEIAVHLRRLFADIGFAGWLKNLVEGPGSHRRGDLAKGEPSAE